MPSQTQGEALVLVSGGFDSMVAAWQMLKRGLHLHYLFFNLGGGKASERTFLQVMKVLHDLWDKGSEASLYICDFSPVVTAIKQRAKSNLSQMLLKMQMYRAAQILAEKLSVGTFVTGESLGQVSTQILSNLQILDKTTQLTVFRPLIGMDKKEIIQLAQHIGTAVLSEPIPEYCALSQGRQHIAARWSQLSSQEEQLFSDGESLQAICYSNIKIISLDDFDLKKHASHYLFSTDWPQDALVIDCQPKSFYKKWHWPDSEHIEFEELLTKHMHLDKNRTYLIYCTHGTKSPIIAEIMQQRGFGAYAFPGGISKMQKFFATGQVPPLAALN